MRVLNAYLRPAGRVVLVLLLLMCASIACAQSDDSQDGNVNDPPTRVARLSFATGDLGLMPAGSTNWSAADVNRPLTNGDKLSSGPDAKAELDLGGASLRINDVSDIGILNLDGHTGQFELTQGTLNISVRTIDQGSTYEIDTPTLALVIEQPGTFRVDVPSDGSSTTIAVSDGLATIYGENNAQRQVFSGRRYQFSDSALSDVMVTDITSSDAFDLWCNDRDAQQANDASAQYVSDDMVGGSELNESGNWEQDQDYGAVWYPSIVAAGWAPYRFGHWAWIWPWGWTWVDSLRWGFAPYHYGRWAFIHNRWGWIPGPRHIRPVYAPALVAFVGTGAGHPVGWFPLGPHDVYSPWYHASRNYYTGVNLANIGVSRYYNQTALIDTIQRPGNAGQYLHLPQCAGRADGGFCAGFRRRAQRSEQSGSSRFPADGRSFGHRPIRLATPDGQQLRSATPGGWKAAAIGWIQSAGGGSGSPSCRRGGNDITQRWPTRLQRARAEHSPQRAGYQSCASGGRCRSGAAAAFCASAAGCTAGAIGTTGGNRRSSTCVDASTGTALSASAAGQADRTASLPAGHPILCAA